MLTCYCSEADEQWYIPPYDFQIFNRKRRKRCCSCKELIEIGSQCTEFIRERVAYSDIEERIYGDVVPLASVFMCEKCSEIFFNLEHLGYCLNPYNSMSDYLKEYWELTGFKPKVKEIE